MSKLANVMGVGDSVCSDIVPRRENDAIKSQQLEREQLEEQLEKRIEEEAGQVEKRKCTPIEYLMLFGEVPKLEQVQILTMDDLAVEDAKRLLDAGCSKRHLLRLYGILTPNGTAAPSRRRETMNNELKPCPFCGGRNLYIDGYEHGAGLRWRVTCLDCMGMVDPGTEQQKYRAIEAWNRRV